MLAAVASGSRGAGEMKFVVMVERRITELAEVEIEAIDANWAKHKANEIRDTLEYTATDSDYSVVEVRLEHDA